MPLHRLLGIDLGVPRPQTLHDFYAHIGFVETGDGWGQKDAVDQIRIAEAPFRQLTNVRLACHDEADLAAIGGRLDGLGIAHETRDGTLHLVDPINKWRVAVTPLPVEDVRANEERIVNRPGARARRQARPLVMTEEAQRPPRRLGHYVIGTTDVPATYKLYVEALGFRVSDKVLGGLGWFLRCSPDHHNMLITPGPVPYLNHYAIERDDIDAVMKAAGGYLAENPGTQISGPGRHQLGGNVFWYLQDPAGNFFEQFADMDYIEDDDAWQPGDWDQPGWSLWGNDRQPEVFFKPHDLAEIIHGFQQQHG